METLKEGSEVSGLLLILFFFGRKKKQLQRSTFSSVSILGQEPAGGRAVSKGCRKAFCAGSP